MTVFHLRLLCGAVDPAPSAPRLLVPSVQACSLSLPTSQQGRRKQVRREQFTSQIKYVLVPLDVEVVSGEKIAEYEKCI